MKAELIKKLESLAKRECWCDDMEEFNPNDFSGGNFDDAYDGGYKDGQAQLAREIIKSINS